jgi:hypothetical protein
LVPDQGAVEQFVPAALDPALHDRVHRRDLNAAEYDADPGIGKDCVEQHRYLPSRSRMRKRARQPASCRSIGRLRMAWVTQAAVGWPVAPRMRMRRVACSMTARTYSRVPVNVAVSKKSAARMALACERRNDV